MRKLNSIIFVCLLILANMSGCGMPGPLYQPTEKQTNKSIDSNKKDQLTKQQEQ
ncbi:lipoprotein [Colwelliaceae bacterium 6441]